MTMPQPTDIPTDAIRTETITLREPPEEKVHCIEFLVDVAASAGRVTDPDDAVAAVLEREAQTPTGFEDGIAIPHAKTSVVTRPTVVFARSSRGVDFGAMDGEPATLIFLLLVPEDSAAEHLAVLSSLARALVHDSTRTKLRSVESAEEVRSALVEAVDR